MVATVIILVTKPLSLIKLSCIFGVRSIFIVVHTWIELLKGTISLHVNVLSRLVIWTFALILLPIRVLTALQRERLLEMHLHAMQAELEYLIWDRKELEERLQMEIKERSMMEVMLAEVEQEHDQAIIKIEVLEGELQDLKNENHRLKEVQSQTLWGFRDQGNTSKDQKKDDAEKHGIPYALLSWNHCSGDDITLKDFLTHNDAWEDEIKSKTEMHNFIKKASKVCGLIHSFTPGIISGNIDVIEVLDQRREVAILQSIFSAILSLLVGVVIWEAEDPCMPLVLALFTVVVLSLKSVVEFFFTMKNRPACDAVALLSFNWFILGSLTYPTLPRIACMFTPLALSILEWAVGGLGLST